ncbi:unnamed protein product [Nippostrongylus brasiliensis]|uniref:Protein PBDC1 (inferred by orthology to a human protein) n=1 Tax=Nippostrongylus brasiliensis TaxID=27835 RepID=A0A0N4YRS8_NIPBR|nr:unnamed protein product [Nippostrongylus brasiliensis]
MDDIDYGDASKYVNDASIEMAWAMKAAERANVHMNLLMCCDTKVLRLNKFQDVIHTSFRKSFPEIDVHKVTEVELKQGEMKERWRDFCESFKDVVEDYSLGTLMRIEACKGYSEENTVVVPKVVYLLIHLFIYSGQ